MSKQTFKKLSYSIATVVLLMSSFAPSYSYAGDDTGTQGNATRGIKVWTDNCMRCHNQRDPREYTDELWRPVITHMRIRAGLTGQDARDILAFFRQSN